MFPTNFTLINIGKIENATINLNRFTILCGKNSAGKSFFSKSLFLLYKTIYEYEDWSYIEIERKFEECLINLQLISKISLTKIFTKEEFSTLKTKISIYIKERDFEALLAILEDITSKIKEFECKQNKNVGFFQGIIDKKLQKKLTNINDIISHLENIIKTLKDNPENIIKESFNYFISSIFRRKICKIGAQRNSKIILGNNYLELKNNKVIDLTCSDILEDKNNIIFVESPFIVEIFEQIAKLTKRLIPFFRVGKRREKYILPYHIEDLINQIREYEIFLNEDVKLLKKIENIIKGKLKYDPLREKIVFQEQGKKYSIPALNTASGILTFGVLYLLLQSGAFDENMILIFEEPETNLHPEWQIKIVELLKFLMEEKGIKIFLTTHSPFIVKAVEVLALEDKNFKENLSVNLLYEDGNTVCDFEESIEKIYDQLLGPFSSLMFKGWFYE